MQDCTSGRQPFLFRFFVRKPHLPASEDLPTNTYKVSSPLKGGTNLFPYKKYTCHTQPRCGPMSLERLDLIGPITQFSYGNSDICSAEERQAPRITCDQVKQIRTPLTKCQAQCLDTFKRRRVTPASWLCSFQICVREAWETASEGRSEAREGKGKSTSILPRRTAEGKSRTGGAEAPSARARAPPAPGGAPRQRAGHSSPASLNSGPLESHTETLGLC